MKRRTKGGEEHDAVTRWRHVLTWRPGERKRIKARMNRRDRRAWRQSKGDE